MLPSAATSKAKMAYSRLDHEDWCRWWNDVNKQNGSPDKNIDFYWADNFPIRTPTVLRTALVEPKLVDVLCRLSTHGVRGQRADMNTVRACWERNLDMSSDTVLQSVITEAGFDTDGIMAKANSPEVKQDLRARTKEAKDTGICGVPSYRVFRRKIGQGEQDWRLVSDIIWGQDETVVVEDLISGWDGESSVVENGEAARSQSGLSKL